MQPAAQMLAGMAAASTAYGVPIVGGHSNNRCERGQLAVAILGRAKKLLTSFDAQPGDTLLMAIDLRGAFEEPYPFWNASSHTSGERLRADLELLPMLAESGLCCAAKDISMAGAVGTAMMLLECSNVGATIDPNAIPKPAGIALDRWLTAFPSYGFVLSVRTENVSEVKAKFASRDIACAAVGVVTSAPQVVLKSGAESALLWDFSAEAFISAKRLPELQNA